MKNIFLIIKLIFVFLILCISVLVISIWNIQSKLPNSNISDYFPNEITKIYDTNYDLLYHVGTKDRFYLEYNQIPKTMIEAILSAEDKNFFDHQGFDLKGIFRAVVINFQNLIFKESKNYVGASTITQQLVKNILLSNEQTITRKLKELILSIRIEHQYSKEYILELYLNEIYFGRRSYGIASAASAYFHKSIYDLTIDEFAYLASLPKGPNNYDPQKNYKKAFDRRNYVLKNMYQNNYINKNEFEYLVKEPISILNHDIKKYNKNYNTDFIISEIKKLNLNNESFYVQSTIDPFIQNLSEKSLLDSLALFEKKYRNWDDLINNSLSNKNDYEKHWEKVLITKVSNQSIKFRLNNSTKELNIEKNLYGPKKISPIKFLKQDTYVYMSKIDNEYILVQPLKINGSMVVLNPYNGNILSLVGGVDYSSSNFNRATQALRQPGSSIKPFIYALGLSNNKFLPNTIILDSKISLDQGPNLPLWIPKNYSNKSYGKLSFRQALEKSNNLITLKIGLELGISDINKFFKKIDLYKNNNKEIFSLLLGSIEQNLLSLTKSYAIFVNGGYEISPTILKKVVTDKGTFVDNSLMLECNYCFFDSNSRSYRTPMIKNKRNRVIDESTSYQILNMLQGAVERGTGKSLNSINYPIAGKTGTTNDSKDLWFFGLTPELVVGVYVGYDKPNTIGYKETGSSVALPVFKRFITDYLKSNKDNISARFNPPKGLVKKYIGIEDGFIYDKLGENMIVDYFTEDQLKMIRALNNDRLGGIN